MKIVGKYVCQVEISISMDETVPGILPFDEIHKKFMGDEITDALKEIISDEFLDGDEGTVNVTKMYGDVYKTEDGGEQE